MFISVEISICVRFRLVIYRLYPANKGKQKKKKKKKKKKKRKRAFIGKTNMYDATKGRTKNTYNTL